MAKKMFQESCPFHELTLFNASVFSNVYARWISSSSQHNASDLALSLIYFDGVINHEELTFAVEALLIGKIFSTGENYFVDVASVSLGRRRIILSTQSLFILNQLKNTFDGQIRVGLSELLSSELDSQLQPYRHQLGIKTPSLQLLCSMAQDFYAMRVHGPLREWMLGTLQTRTLRVEALARHTFNKPERLQFDQRQHRRQRFVCNDFFLRELLDEALNNSEYGGSRSLRIKRLRDQLRLAQSDFLLIADQVATKFVLFLCDQRGINAPGTIKKHYLNARDFIQFSARDANTYDEFVNQDWAQLVSAYFDLYLRRQEKEVVINLLLKMLGIRLIASNSDTQNGKTKQSIQPYADFLSQDEIERLATLLESSNQPKSTKNHTLIMLRALNDVPMRREDVATIRIGDVVNHPYSPHIIISSETTGTKKSVNANRVVALEKDVMLPLQELAEAKMAVFQDPKTGLFSGLDDPSSFDGGFEILAILSQGMQAITGAVDLTPHHFRSGVMTRKTRKILSVQYALHASSDELRLVLYESFVFSGHGDLRTLFEHYVCDMEWIRREWVDYLGALYFKPSAIFLSAISGLNPETLRKYGRSDAQLHVFLKRQLKDCQLSFQDRIVPIQSLLAHDVDHYPFFEDPDEVQAEDRQLSLIRHRMLCISGINSEISANLLHLAPDEVAGNDHAFHLISLASQSNWSSTIPAGEVLAADYIQKLLRKLGALSLSSEQLVGIAQCVPSSVGDPWELDIKTFALFPDDFFIRIKQAGFDSVFCFSKVIKQHAFDAVVARLLPSHHERQNHRNFADGKNAKVKFVFRGDARSAWPRRSKQATAWVSLFLLGLFIVQFEEKICQRRC